MIQRIQSVFMLLAAGLLGLEFALPFASSQSNGSGFFSDSVYNVFDSNILLAIVASGILLSIVAIFLFKNRKLQSSLIMGSAFLCVVLLATGYILASNDQSGALSGLKLGLGAFLPIGSTICLILANRFIKKDENLVKSMDRLR